MSATPEIDHDLTAVAAEDLPEALASIHRALEPDQPIRVRTAGTPTHLRHLFVGAGFAVDGIAAEDPAQGNDEVAASDASATIDAIKLHTLADRVGPGMRVLLCGLNPSPSSADSGVGFFKAGNRFWPAALAAGLVSIDRDPGHALVHHRVGMTDVVKRSTRRADEVTTEEYRAGLERIRHLVEWLQPGALCLVGLAGWRAAVDRRAARGWQPDPLGTTPVYLMPSTSGLNAHDTVDTLANHLRSAQSGPPATHQ